MAVFPAEHDSMLHLEHLEHVRYTPQQHTTHKSPLLVFCHRARYASDASHFWNFYVSEEMRCGGFDAIVSKISHDLGRADCCHGP